MRRVVPLASVGAALAAALAVGLWLGVDSGESSAAESTVRTPVQHFHSRPDLRPPLMTIVRGANGVAPDYVFLAPKKQVVQAGPMIVDNQGRLVWFDPRPTKGVTDFKVQRLG